ncbi:MAG: T9SS type A sorting domain-containing protein [Flavobacteriales bacterium]|nr:T9SS type A sorting domain-containing protein [Flavobacteriales bacterium]
MKTTIFLFFSLIFTYHSSAQELSTITISSNGIARSFDMQLPVDFNDLPNNLPLVIVLHGSGGSGSDIGAYSGFYEAAIANNFISVFPNGISGEWNVEVNGDLNDGPDDVRFIGDIIDYLCGGYAINQNKVYVTGHSRGAYMAYHLAVASADKIAAIAPVAGSMYGDNTFITNYLQGGNFVKIPIMHIHGDADQIVPYPDPNHQPTPYGEWPLTGFSVPTCGATTYNANDVIEIMPNVQKIPFCTNTGDSKEISLIRLLGGGHNWPNINTYPAAQEIWNFFNQHQLTLANTCVPLSITHPQAENFYKIYPNPAKEVLNIEGLTPLKSVIIYDILGNMLSSTFFNSSNLRINLNNLKPGLYLIKMEDNNGNQAIERIVKK